MILSGMTVEVLGTVLGTAIQGQIVGMANAPCVPGPADIIAGLNNTSVGLNVSENGISLDHTVSTCLYHDFTVETKWTDCLFICDPSLIRPSLALQKVAYMIASGIICLIYIICALVLFFGVREQKGKTSFSVSTFIQAFIPVNKKETRRQVVYFSDVDLTCLLLIVSEKLLQLSASRCFSPATVT